MIYLLQYYIIYKHNLHNAINNEILLTIMAHHLVHENKPHHVEQHFSHTTNFRHF